MGLKITCLFVICICMVVGIIMSAKYLKTKSRWLVITLLLIGLIISIINIKENHWHGWNGAGLTNRTTEANHWDNFDFILWLFERK